MSGDPQQRLQYIIWGGSGLPEEPPRLQANLLYLCSAASL